jgi:pantoate--beta-alanine ligase
VERVAAAVRSGRTDYPVLEAGAMQALTTRGWAVDYCSIRRRADLGTPQGQQPLVVVAAATLGTTRLIDNNEV